MMQMVHDRFAEYLLNVNIKKNKYQRKTAHDNFYKGELVKTLKAVTMMHFNYMDSTMLSNSTVYRFVRIYRRHILKEKKWFKIVV